MCIAVVILENCTNILPTYDTQQYLRLVNNLELRHASVLYEIRYVRNIKYDTILYMYMYVAAANRPLTQADAPLISTYVCLTVLCLYALYVHIYLLFEWKLLDQYSNANTLTIFKLNYFGKNSIKKHIIVVFNFTPRLLFS